MQSKTPPFMVIFFRYSSASTVTSSRIMVTPATVPVRWQLRLAARSTVKGQMPILPSTAHETAKAAYPCPTEAYMADTTRNIGIRMSISFIYWMIACLCRR